MIDFKIRTQCDKLPVYKSTYELPLTIFMFILIKSAIHVYE